MRGRSDEGTARIFAPPQRCHAACPNLTGERSEVEDSPWRASLCSGALTLDCALFLTETPSSVRARLAQQGDPLSAGLHRIFVVISQARNESSCLA